MAEGGQRTRLLTEQEPGVLGEGKAALRVTPGEVICVTGYGLFIVLHAFLRSFFNVLN